MLCICLRSTLPIRPTLPSPLCAQVCSLYIRQPVGISHVTRGLNPVLCDNLEGWDGVGNGREVHEGGDICIPVADSC